MRQSKKLEARQKTPLTMRHIKLHQVVILLLENLSKKLEK